MNFFQRLFGTKKEERTKVSTPEPVPETFVDPVATTAPLTAAPLTTDTPTTPMSPPPPSMPMQTRPLPPLKDFQSRYPQIKFGAASDIGGRANNEDSYLTLLVNASVSSKPPAISVFVVADGMGGHENGENASAITVQTIAQYITDEVVLPQLAEIEGQGASSSYEQKTIPEVLAEAMEAANNAVQLNYPGGGTTATCAVIRDDLAYIAHVGDSRAYLIIDGHLELITRDHLLVRRLQELGQLTAEEADIHPQRNVLYRAVGQSEVLEVDAATRRLPPSARLLICSDGLWGVIGDKAINEILNNYPDPQQAVERMISMVNEQNGADNITAILLQMPD